VWATSLADRYDAALGVLTELIEACPDEHWSDPVWTVRRTDRHVWPIVRGMGGDLSDDQRLQLQAAFWNVVVHSLHALDGYLTGGVEPFSPPPPFDGWQMPGHVLPDRPPTRDELLGYVAQLRARAADILGRLTEEDETRPARRGLPFADLLIHELVHLAEHNAQLEQFLNMRTGWSRPNWNTSDRWFQPCEHCEQDSGAT
jgi:hypothetical protein